MVGGSGFMHTEIFNQIDLLVSMAGSTLDTSEIESELIHINKDIQDKKQSVQDLKSMMNDTRYFNASNELVDRNIEVSLKSKLARLNQKIKDLQLKLNQIKKEESKLHDDISSLKANIEENEKYIHTLETKTTDNSSYQEILQSEKNHLNHLTEELKHKDERYQKVLKDLDLNESSMLAGVPNAPSVYAPNINPTLAKQRQTQVINAMLKYGYISNEQALEVI